jgi:hypothetical protein
MVTESGSQTHGVSHELLRDAKAAVELIATALALLVVRSLGECNVYAVPIGKSLQRFLSGLLPASLEKS